MNTSMEHFQNLVQLLHSLFLLRELSYLSMSELLLRNSLILQKLKDQALTPLFILFHLLGPRVIVRRHAHSSPALLSAYRPLPSSTIKESVYNLPLAQHWHCF